MQWSLWLRAERGQGGVISSADVPLQMRTLHTQHISQATLRRSHHAAANTHASYFWSTW